MARATEKSRLWKSLQALGALEQMGDLIDGTPELIIPSSLSREL